MICNQKRAKLITYLFLCLLLLRYINWILIDFINQLRRKGTPLVEAVIQGTLLRLRPIFITSITTVLGLAPLGLGIAGEEPLLAPMAIAISFGLAFATVLALFIVPTAYLIVEDIRRLTQGKSENEAV